MKKFQQGFTLIELMIVVAIIGILAAFAIPAYEDYIARTQAAEGIELMGGGKTPMAEYYADKGKWPAFATSVMGNVSGKYTRSVAITNGAGLTAATLELTATLKAPGSVNSKVGNATITLITKDGGKNWSCVKADATNAPTIVEKYLPGACK